MAYMVENSGYYGLDVINTHIDCLKKKEVLKENLDSREMKGGKN